MGTTMACAQCHTHKYDPITITEYFRSYAFLNQTADSDKGDERPTMEILTPEQKAAREALQKRSAAAEAAFAQPRPEWLKGYEAWLATKANIPEKKVAALFALPKEKRNAAQTKQLQDYYVRNVAPETKAERETAAQLKQQLAALKPPTVPVLQELPAAQRRKTFVQLRGNWQALRRGGQRGRARRLASLPRESPDRPPRFRPMADQPAQPADRPRAGQPPLGDRLRRGHRPEQRGVRQPRRPPRAP